MATDDCQYERKQSCIWWHWPPLTMCCEVYFVSVRISFGHATRQRIEAQHANEARSDQNRAQHAITWGECDDTWQCHGTTCKNFRCQRLTQATTRVARGATPAIWTSLVDNHLRERAKALSAPQSGPAKQLASPVYHLSGVQACRIDCPEPLSGQTLRSADGRGAL